MESVAEEPPDGFLTVMFSKVQKEDTGEIEAALERTRTDQEASSYEEVELARFKGTYPTSQDQDQKETRYGMFRLRVTHTKRKSLLSSSKSKMKFEFVVVKSKRR